MTRLKRPLLLVALTPAAALAQPASWNNATLASATYYVQDANIIGSTTMLNNEQMVAILAAVKRDTAGAIKRRYPKSSIATDPKAPGVIVVQPTFTAPSALVPWAKLNLRYDLALPDGNVAITRDFTVWELYQHTYNAMNYAGDTVIALMP